MTRAGEAWRGRDGRARLLASATALLLLAVLPLLLGSCGPPAAADEASAGDGAPALDTLRRRLAPAADALRAGDRDAFLRLAPIGPSTSPRAAGTFAEVFDALSPLPWTSFEFAVTALEGRPGVFRVAGVGRLGFAGPPDRLAVVRYLRLVEGAPGVEVAVDETPEELQRRYLMALHRPVALQRPGFIVLADGRARDRARLVAAAAGRALPRLKALGLDTDDDVLITVYGSVEDVHDALAVELSTARLRFFAHEPLRAGEGDWQVDDVGVLGPWLRGSSATLDGVLAHELAHAYTVRWFAGDPEPSALLVEGVAGAAEGAAVSPDVRREVASGNHLWPLPESFAVTDVWDGGDAAAVRLGYAVGQSLVEYVGRRWGAGRLERFVRAAGGAEATEAGLDGAFGDALGVSWREFYEGWRRYVLRGGASALH